MKAAKTNYVREGCYRRHDCPRRAQVDADLATIHETWRGRRGPRVEIPLSRFSDAIAAGDEITVYDKSGRQMRADVEDIEVVARLKISTDRKAKVAA